MEINDQNIAALGQYLQQTLNPNAEERKKAEAFLKVKIKIFNFETVKSSQILAMRNRSWLLPSITDVYGQRGYRFNYQNSGFDHFQKCCQKMLGDRRKNFASGQTTSKSSYCKGTVFYEKYRRNLSVLKF